MTDDRHRSGDMDPEQFRREAHRIADWIADYFANVERYPVLAQVKPGEIRSALPSSAPQSPERFSDIFADFERILLPGITHWNHPGFFAYFAISGSAPGVLAEFLSAALNVQAMLWRTSPAATELEEVTLGWLRQLLGLPAPFEGVIYDTASISTLHALAAAREAAVPRVRAEGLAGRSDLPRLRVYCSDQSHSSVDKAVILLGLGHESLRHIESDSDFRMKPAALEAAIIEDRHGGPAACRRRGHGRKYFVDEHRSGAGHWRHLQEARDMAARGCRVRRRGGHGSRLRVDPGRRRRCRLSRRESPQMALHAV